MKEELKQETRALLALIQRSDDTGDGWRKVSSQLWPSVQKWGHERLTEFRSDETGNYARLTSEGKTVLDFI